MECKGCSGTLDSGMHFCPSCGEIAHPHRLDLKHIFHEFIHAFLHADKGIFLLVKQLAQEPGVTALSYVNGSRKKYFNPVSFLLIAGGLTFFLRHQLAVELPAGSKKMSFYIAEFMHRYSTAIIVLTVPVLSLYSWLFFKSTGKNYSENMVMNLYMMGEYHLFTIICYVIPAAFFPQAGIVLSGISMLIMAVYYYFTCKNFFQQNYSVILLKIILIELLYLLTTAIIMGISLIAFFIMNGLHINDLR